jgi:hypothetical protein
MKRPLVASTLIEAIFRSGERKKVRLIVRLPWKGRGNWWAVAEIKGLDEQPMRIAGEDSMQALTLAIGCMVFRLESLQTVKQFRLVWPGTKMTYKPRQFIFDPGAHPSLKTE